MGKAKMFPEWEKLIPIVDKTTPVLKKKDFPKEIKIFDGCGK